MTTDMSSPKGKQVLGLLFVGFFALVCSYLVDSYVPQQQTLWYVLTGFLLLIVAVSFIAAGRIARKMRREADAMGARKND